jgi:hypothetical protein
MNGARQFNVISNTLLNFYEYYRSISSHMSKQTGKTNHTVRMTQSTETRVLQYIT